MQTGSRVEDWPLVVINELIDNALDACEEADVAPEITVMADAAGIAVIDNGPGLPESMIELALEYALAGADKCFREVAQTSDTIMFLICVIGKAA